MKVDKITAWHSQMLGRFAKRKNFRSPYWLGQQLQRKEDYEKNSLFCRRLDEWKSKNK